MHYTARYYCDALDIPGARKHANMSIIMNNSAVMKLDFTGAADEPRIMENRIREVLSAHGRLSTNAAQLSSDQDLYAAGMTSLASVNVMLALEGEFNVEFPDQMLNRSVFSSIDSIAAALRKIDAA